MTEYSSQCHMPAQDMSCVKRDAKDAAVSAASVVFYSVMNYVESTPHDGVCDVEATQ